MKFKMKPIYKGIGAILFLFILLTFIIVLVTLPSHFMIKFDLQNFRIDSNVPLSYVKDQVVDYYKILFSGSFGETTTHKEVWQFIKPYLLRSVILLTGAIILSIVFGVIKGVFDSKKEKERASNLKLLSSLTLLSMPDIFVIIVIQSFIIWLYEHGIKILPAFGYEGWTYGILPMLSLSIIPAIYIARITTLSIDEIYKQEYIKTAMGKGASRFRVLWVHVFRNAIVEIVGSFSSVATILISSLLIVEYMFYYPGLTLVMYNNYLKGETNVVIGVAIIIGLTYYIIDLLFKGLRLLLNPKAREHEA